MSSRRATNAKCCGAPQVCGECALVINEPRISPAMAERFRRAVAGNPLLYRIFDAWAARENKRGAK